MDLLSTLIQTPIWVFGLSLAVGIAAALTGHKVVQGRVG